MPAWPTHLNVQLRRPIHQSAQRLHLRLQLGKPEVHRLVAKQRLAKDAALGRVPAGATVGHEID